MIRLVPATAELLEADLAGTLGEALGVRVPGDWPPEHYDREAVEWMRDAFAASEGWSNHYVLLGDEVVGTCGYTGPPRDGEVEIGYSVVASHHRQGIATEAVRRLIDDAFTRGATRVVAHTLPDGVASIGVLAKLGFTEIEGREGTRGWALTSTR